jgi:hypothetical protein
MNSLQILFEIYPEADWEYGNLSENPNLSFDMVKNNLYYNKIYYNDWDFSDLSENPAITTKNLEEYDFLPWDYHSLSKNLNLKWDFVEKNINKEWDMMDLSANPVITYDIVKKFPDIEWSWYGLLTNPNMTFDIIKSDSRFWNNLDNEFPDNLIDMDNTSEFLQNCNKHFWLYLYQNPNITWNDIEKYIKQLHHKIDDKPRVHIRKMMNKLYFLSSRICTMDKLEYLDINNFSIFDHIDRLLCNPNLTYDIISKYAKNINWNRIGRTLPLTSEILKKHKEEFNNNPEYIYHLSQNRSLTFEMILNNLDINWDWYWLSQHPNITYENIISKQLPWNWKGISANPNIDWKTVYNNPDKEWDFFHISRNKFLKEPIVNERNNYNKFITKILKQDNRTYKDINNTIKLY